VQPDPDDALWVWSPLDSQEIGPRETLTVAAEPNWPTLGVDLDRTDLRLYAELDDHVRLENRSAFARLVERQLCVANVLPCSWPGENPLAFLSRFTAASLTLGAHKLRLAIFNVRRRRRCCDRGLQIGFACAGEFPQTDCDEAEDVFHYSDHARRQSTVERAASIHGEHPRYGSALR
jgi:hypothetical protein